MNPVVSTFIILTFVVNFYRLLSTQESYKADDKNANCKWNVTHDWKSYPARSSLYLTFYPSKDSCKQDGVLLILSQSNTTKCDRNKLYGVYAENTNEEKFLFTNLLPGFYCVEIEPSGDECEKCDPVLFTKAVRLLSSNSSSPLIVSALVSKKVEERWMLPTLFGIFSVCLIAFLLAFLPWRQKKRKHYRTVKEKKVFTEENTQMVNIEERQATVVKEIVLLNIYQDEGQVEKVRNLAKFLQSCGLTVCMTEDELGPISVKPEKWVQEKLSQSHTKIILVELPIDIDFQENSANNKFLDALFCYALDHVNSKQSVDYKNVFVVRLGTVPSHRLLSPIVPGKRYTLPQHLPELYSDLIDKPAKPDFKWTWQFHPSYITLCDSLR